MSPKIQHISIKLIIGLENVLISCALSLPDLSEIDQLIRTITLADGGVKSDGQDLSLCPLFGYEVGKIVKNG